MTTAEKTAELKAQLPKRPIEIAKDTLRTLSEEVKDLVEDGTFPTINDAIMETLYKGNGHTTFNTFMDWKQKGMQVKKGEKAFLLWSKPKEIPVAAPKADQEQRAAETGAEEEDTYKFYGIAYLFSNKQVEPIPENEPVPDTEQQDEPLSALIYE